MDVPGANKPSMPSVGNVKTCCQLTSVSIKTDSSMETLAMLENVKREQNLRALPLLLDPVEGPLQIEPETDLLQGCARRRVTVQLRHLETDDRGKGIRGAQFRKHKTHCEYGHEGYTLNKTPYL